MQTDATPGKQYDTLARTSGRNESTVGSTGGCRPPLRNANVFDAELAEIEKRIAKLQRAAAAVRERMLPP